MKWHIGALVLVALGLGADAHPNGAPVPSCSITKNIVTDFSADNTGLVDQSSAWTSMNSAAVSFIGANPGATYCLTGPAGRYFFGTGISNTPIGDGITSFIVNMPGATLTNALNLSAISGASGQAVLTFTSVPSGVATGQAVIDDTNPTALDGTLTVQSINTGAHTVTLTGNISPPGVASGDIISFKGGGFALGTKGLTNSNTISALLNQVNVGDTTLVLQNSGDNTKFSVGGWVVATGIQQQTNGGYPPNNYYHQFFKVTSISGANIGVDRASKFTLLTTWPNYDPGGGGSINQGGPALLSAMPSTWDVTQYYNGMTVIGWDGPGNTLVNSNGRVVNFTNMTFPTFGMNVSQNQAVTLTSSSIGAQQELDKVWESATYTNDTLRGFTLFSGTANDTLTLSGIHVTGPFNGSTGTLNVNNSVISGGIQIGATANGITSKISCLNSSISGISQGGGIRDTVVGVAGVTMSGGLMTIPLTAEKPIPWAIPGAQMYLELGGVSYRIPFSVTSVTADATNTYVQTSFAGGFPGGLTYTAVNAAPALSVNFVGCSGSNTVLDWSQVGAQNNKAYSYTNRIYTCTAGLPAQVAANPGVPVIDLNNVPANDPIMVGAIVSVTVNVSQADTSGAGSVNWHIGGQFDNGQIYDNVGGSSTWAPIINLKTAATRTYIGALQSWTNAQTGDTLTTTTNPGYLGGNGGFAPFSSTNVSSETAAQCPIVTFTVTTQ